MSTPAPSAPDRPSRPVLRPPLSNPTHDRDYRSRLIDPATLLAEPGARVLLVHGTTVLGDGAGSPSFLDASEFEVHPDAVLYLGRAAAGDTDLAEGAPLLAVLVDDPAAHPAVAHPDDEWIDLRSAGASLSARDAALAAQAIALANWHAIAGFSPATGVPTTITQSGWARVDEGGREYFPRTDAAVIVAVLDDEDRILLGSNAGWGQKRFSLLAGFVEAGESLESAVIREIFEEAGVVVTDPVYRGSQPWPFPASLMVGFEARIAPGTSSVPVPDGEELRELRWFSRAELTAAVADGTLVLPRPTSIAHAIIADWFGGPLPEAESW